jgi:hypothetical protein
MDSQNKVAGSVLAEAFNAVKVRDKSHGEIAGSFDAIAALWDAYVRYIPNGRIKAVDVAHMMNLLKVVRSVHGDAKSVEHYADAAGYESLAAVLAGVEVTNAER